MDKTIQIRERGVLTLPAELRQQYGIHEGDTFHIVDLDGMFLLTPIAAMVPDLARQIEKMRVDEGLSTQELLGHLKEQRERYYREKYENGASA